MTLTYAWIKIFVKNIYIYILTLCTRECDIFYDFTFKEKWLK